MRILAVGGGSGGHVTPVAAVCKELYRYNKQTEVRFWCDKKFSKQAWVTMQAVGQDIKIDTIIAGKLRRYNGLSMLQHILRVRSILLPNCIDTVKLFAGTVQSFFKLLMWRPDVVFTKGGFVCLPVGLAAALLRIPIVIHDSDAHPGLTNRILARFAVRIATGAPLKHYSYPKQKATYVGIPVNQALKPVARSKQVAIKRSLGFDHNEPLVVITGGGLGATVLNTAVVNALEDLLHLSTVVLIAGTSHEAAIKNKIGTKKRNNFKVHGYIASDEMVELLSAADVVVSRAGATTLLELAALAKPAVIVPAKHLTGNHQTKNAAVYAQASAISLIDESQLAENPLLLVDALHTILLNSKKRDALAKKIHSFSKPRAAQDMAKLIVEAALKA